jgi:hypothetical protein
MHRRPALPTLFALGALVCSCSWSRFDDLRDDPPVVRLDAPVDIDRFGARLASAPLDKGGGLILVGGNPETSLPLASYVIADDRPSTSPEDRGFCGEACVSGRSISAWRTVADHQGPCFLIGVGTRSGVTGLIGRCSDGTDFALDVPHDNTQSQAEPTPREVVDAALAGHAYPGFIQHAVSAEPTPVLAAAAPSARVAWFYAAGSLTPVSLPTPAAVLADDVDDFGAAVAVMLLSNGDHLLAVSAPGSADPATTGRVWLYRVDSADQVTSWGCLSGSFGFGATMLAGAAVGDASDDLLVADAQSVSVFDGSVLASHVQPQDCPEATTPWGVVSCQQAEGVSGCGRAPFSFGRAITLGDLDGDGAAELIVGMGEADVDGEGGAGAVLVYRFDGTSRSAGLAAVARIAAPSPGQGLGSSVTTVRIGRRDVLAAGSPGADSVFLFYCSAIGGAGRDSFRCP